MMQHEDPSNTTDRAANSSEEILKWDDVLHLARHGNPPPPRRVEKTDMADDEPTISRHERRCFG